MGLPKEGASMIRYARATHRTRQEAGKMNKTEEAFSRVLEGWKATGQILRWDFEPEKLRLADRTFYTPDFRVIDRDSVVAFYEVKGFMRDDAAVKIKVAAEQHPYPFMLVKMVKGVAHLERVGGYK